MKKAIKIGLIALAIIAIGVGIFLGFSLTPGLEAININETFFVSQIKQQAQSQIDSAATFSDANSAFNLMLQEVNDALYLENIDNDEALNSKKMLAYYFAPKLTAHGDSCFAAHEWSSSEMNDMKQAAQVVLNANILPGDSQDLPKLNSIIKNVDDYNSALKVAECNGCNSVSAVKQLIDKAKSYKRAPLTNCTSLKNALDAVDSKAKDKLASSIISKASSAASGHGSKDEALASINEYVNAFGGSSQFADVKSKINAAKSRAESQRQARAEQERENRINSQINSTSDDDDDELVF